MNCKVNRVVELVYHGGLLAVSIYGTMSVCKAETRMPISKQHHCCLLSSLLVRALAGSMS